MDDAVALLRLEGGKANAMTPELLATIERLIDDFERGPARAGVLVGYDRYFSGGLALPRIIDFDRPAMRQFIDHFARVMTRVLACEKPIVAAINGHAIAGGCVLALMCDWRIIVADDAVRIGLSEAQLGLGLPAIISEPLRAQVPPASLVPIALEGHLFAPRAAAEVGLVHEVVASAELLDRATAKAGLLSVAPAIAVAQIKRTLRAPVLAAMQASAAVQTEDWLDTWFAPEAQTRLRATVARLAR